MVENARRDFDPGAREWDQEPIRVKMTRDIAQSMLKELPFDSKMDVLDFGCGTGLLTLEIQPFVKSIIGIDTSHGMLEILRSKVESQGLSTVRFQQIDLEKGDPVEGLFHAIVSSMALHHVPDTKNLLDRFYQLLYPSGFLAIADLDAEGGFFHEDSLGVFHQGFDRQALKRLFETVGFWDVRDCTAAWVRKPGPDGQEKVFTVFLMIGQKIKRP